MKMSVSGTQAYSGRQVDWESGHSHVRSECRQVVQCSYDGVGDNQVVISEANLCVPHSKCRLLPFESDGNDGDVLASFIVPMMV